MLLTLRHPCSLQGECQVTPLSPIHRSGARRPLSEKFGKRPRPPIPGDRLWDQALSELTRLSIVPQGQSSFISPVPSVPIQVLDKVLQPLGNVFRE